ncbi:MULTISPECIES: DNA topoisomerase VI subunit B [Archaeoglobus]|jgi:DNA topoisomerase-6 subunit B|uniref:Type 2 DNA topoisomerase 6 subunit B n=3 Tax=Archaeoglobus fulgidus TaxID=2234 RepID=TOP6B_ARCFU|nr:MULTISPECIES: DNA topoisomerase VI subunit B [Archaeoglobus]O29605.1 RecName: Full=Type 2 DNA topoisomerase 6 subunit B; AltName: Full=Type II DNA topoisomerase VI subunit B; Short=TopoVI-B [Archaeoglobus fulgidus DSM 4304]AAB90588.1 DNA topoisomerase VI, subunit B (top6B) [Archaeoglobus fulgidus DSM 4304]AIG97532.1 DNA topoisomerase VI, B subunit [Archaeoglobus fulgidus DSM 8774]KUJ93440.1 MAG: Type 2 DNA topoisomerase 6 subunit B [Archaeoglobus fulgidus]KUK07083.1 MAG: Type 2 DNA topoisom
MSGKHREISVAEFFEKNKHILGYSNPAKAIITVVKEAVDNALDACEEAGILPDIFVRISKVDDHFKIVVEDNGPGIPREQIPKVFGKLLYGSRFHEIRQSRGQQGIGISAAVLYAQLTTGKPATVISKTPDEDRAKKVVLYINTKKNEPEIVEEGEEEWYLPSGTKIELEVAGNYVRERKQSVYEYLRETSVINPHAKITFVEPDGTINEFKRVTDDIPQPPKSIKPHPHGIELGTLMSMLKSTRATTLRRFLKEEFVRVGEKIADDVLRKAGFSGDETPQEMGRDDAAKLLNAFRQTDFLPPPTDCLSPIGEAMIAKSLMAEFQPEFVYAVTRKPKVYSGHPFLVEVGLAYGGEIKSEKVTLLRYANKIPLLYQQGGCALTKAVESVNWKSYGMVQNRGELPSAPAVILIHLASTNIPYTSESKESVAAIPEIIDETRLALQEVGRRLKEYLERKSRQQKKKKKEEMIGKVLPLIAKKVCEILEKEPLEIDRIVARIMGYLHVERIVEERDGVKVVTIRVSNFTRSKKSIKLYEMCSGNVEADGAKVSGSGYSTVTWSLEVKPDEEVEVSYRLKGRIINKNPLVEGVEEDLLSGAEVMNFA